MSKKSKRVKQLQKRLAQPQMQEFKQLISHVQNQMFQGNFIEKGGNVVKETRRQLGQQPPRYNFFLNPYKDTRFTTCPQCGNKTRTRTFSLVIQIGPTETLLWGKICRYCYHCDLIIMHQDKLEELLIEYFMVKNPQIIGNDYVVLGTVERSDSKRALSDTLSLQQMLEHLHDFKKTISFRPSPV